MMGNQTSTGGRPGKMIHVRLPEAIHRKLKIHTAQKQVTVQEWVSRLIADTLRTTSSKK